MSEKMLALSEKEAPFLSSYPVFECRFSQTKEREPRSRRSVILSSLMLSFCQPLDSEKEDFLYDADSMVCGRSWYLIELSALICYRVTLLY